MIFSAIQKVSSVSPKQIFVRDVAGEYSYSQMCEKAISMAASMPKDSERLYIYMPDSSDLLSLICAADLAGLDACVLNRQFSASEVVAIMDRLGRGILASDTDSPEFVGVERFEYRRLDGPPCRKSSNKLNNSRIIILTTGTTGSPKAVVYTWERLLSQVKKSAAGCADNWLLAYPMNHFAGIQVFIHALLNTSSLSIPAGRTFTEVTDCLKKDRVNAISATPTFWRMFVGMMAARNLTCNDFSISKITLGGEAATEDVLSRLRKNFPAASLVHVYAITELGSCFSVSDGLPGFPAGYLKRKTGNVELKISEGELYLKTESHMLSYLNSDKTIDAVDGWLATGDYVELKRDRVFFLGRKSEIINVGGIKVFPLRIEEEILKTPGVQAVRVYGRANPVTGKVVAADIEIARGYDSRQVMEALRINCRAVLGKYEQPVFIRPIESLERANEKIVRRQL